MDIELDKIMDIEDLRVYELVDGKELEYLQDQDAKRVRQAFTAWT